MHVFELVNLPGLGLGVVVMRAKSSCALEMYNHNSFTPVMTDYAKLLFFL